MTDHQAAAAHLDKLAMLAVGQRRLAYRLAAAWLQSPEAKVFFCFPVRDASLTGRTGPDGRRFTPSFVAAGRSLAQADRPKGSGSGVSLSATGGLSDDGAGRAGGETRETLRTV